MLQKELHGMHTRCNKIVKLCIILTASQLLSGCGLLPKKEDPRLAPTLESYEEKIYNIVPVEKGNILLAEKINCTYSQLKEENLNFSLTGKTIEKVYYNTGDSVKKGDLLAQLELGNIDSDIENLNYSIGKTKLLLSHADQLMELDIAKQHIISDGSDLSEEESVKAITNIRKQYESSTQTYHDSLYIEEMKLAALQEKRETYRLYAGMNGTLSYVKGHLEGSQCTKDEVIFTIIDNSSGAFRADTNYASNFTDGEKVIVSTTNNSYPVIATPSKEDENVVYFHLETPDFELKIGDKGNVQLIIDQHENVLYLPRTAVKKMDDSYYVYYLDQTNVQNIKPVEIGLEGDGKVEIIKGLEYGDAVIKK